MDTLFKHQKDIINDDPKKCGLFLGTGSSKTRIALELAEGRILIIVPKTQKEDGNWERENKKWGINKRITTISKEMFRRDFRLIGHFDTVIVDEAHTCLGVTPNTRQRKKVTIPRASQLFEALEWFIENRKPSRFYMCTATIMKSPMTVWGAAKLLGFDWDFYRFRHTFYTKLPMPGREVFAPRRNQETKERLADAVKKLGYVGRLEDYFDVPDQTFRTITIELTEKQKERLKQIPLEYPDPIVRIGKRHQIENGSLKGDEFNAPETFPNGKIDKILELAEEFPRMVVFAKYTLQLDQIVGALMDTGYNVLRMDGKTEHREGHIKFMKENDGIFVVQAQISAGWELPETPVMVFASRTYSFVDYDQALGRIQRANNIKKNLYISLVVKGGIDEAVDDAIASKNDFNEVLYAHKETI